jgi:serine/threonine protein kinase
MFNKNRHVVVIDFGTARLLDEKNSDGRQKNTEAGTPYYMTPEMKIKKEFSFSTDLWAIALIVFNCLTGTEMFSGGSVQEVTAKVLDVDLSNISKLEASS